MRLIDPALRAARLVHTLVPCGQLRTARLLLELNGHAPLEVHRRLFGYDLSLKAHRDTTHLLLYLQGESFLSDVALIAPHLRPGMVALDVGANVGAMSLYLRSRIGPLGQLFSFEPAPENFAELEANFRNNHLRNCQALQVAVGAQEGVITFPTGRSGHIPDDGAEGPRVPVVTVDGFIQQQGLPRVDFVKVDVGGSEEDVLAGMRATLDGPDKPILSIEVQGRGGAPRADPRRVCEVLETHYRTLRAYVAPADLRAKQHCLRRLWSQVSPFEDLEQACRVDLREVKQHDTRRYQLLCLP
ncbi:FkbM family methyltransferase [Corallococcus macrosporus]|uniref:FkbM family methyltransferase n=1 Tax=Myxococcus fulvus (strain ATCC BAA-855 / HW-1) TaxID=483219 RepID=F8CKP1_MYXFH|nr:FkbM family methyltransferase [Corallococcus macrosporus]AEI62706.1 FkbM family methyltransferase [Corallococcus macrosporus]